MSISIIISGGTTNSAVFSQMFHGVIVNESDKALQVKGDDGRTVWLPKSGLTAKREGEYYTLKGWFRQRMDSYVWRVLQDNASIGGQSVAP